MIAQFKKSVMLLAAVSLLVAPFYILSTPKPVHGQVCMVSAMAWATGLLGAAWALAGLSDTEAHLELGEFQISSPQLGATGSMALSQMFADALQSGLTASALWKECVLDPLAWLAKTIIIEALTAAIVDWINSGFQGEPTFITDLDGFLLDVADRVAGDFIVGNGLGFLCSPYLLDIQIRLLLSYYAEWGSEGTYCKLSDVVTNIENFINGNFFDGGWMGWFTMSMYPSGNPTGSFFKAADELAWRVGNKTGEEDNLLSRAWNFFSGRNGLGNINLPGKYIENELNSWTDSPLMQLEVADEVDEIVTALFTELVKEILTGAGGLRGVSDGYTDRLRDGQKQACLTLQQDLIEQINALIAAEQASGRTEFLARLNDLLARAQAVQCTVFPDDTAALRRIQAELQALKAEMDGRHPVCSDLIDNDRDGKTDYPADPGCTDANDISEEDAGSGGPPGGGPPLPSQCNDGLDNDSDGQTDYPADTGCTSATDTSETDGGGGGGPGTPPPPPPALCADGLDNDGDGQTDYPADTGCTSATDNDETNSTTLTATATAAPTVSPVPPLTVNFTGSATGGSAAYTFSWNFGDGNNGTGANVTHTYVNNGTFTATLTVTSGANTATATVRITIGGPGGPP